MYKLSWFCILSISFALVSCKGSESSEAAKRYTVAELTQSGGRIAPNHARFVGTITKINPIPETARPGTPCAKAPCTAVVTVDSLIGYGMAFPGTLDRGKELKINFRFTLGKTGEIFPDLNEELPGLKEGDSFFADIEGVNAMNDRVNYSIYNYKILKKAN